MVEWAKVEPTINLMAAESSCRRSLIGIKSWVDWLKAMYSASVVLRSISVCILEDHKTGLEAKVILYPVRERTEEGSLELEGDQP